MEQREKRPKETPAPDPAQKTESVYENFNKVPLKVLDLFIGLCVAALVIIIAVGVMNR